MGDHHPIHSDPCTNSDSSHNFNCNRQTQCSSLGWDLHNLGVLNADMSLVMDSTPPYFSDLEFDSGRDLSTGYLEDALLEFSERSKRRRLSFYAEDDRRNKEFDEFNDSGLMGYWSNKNCRWDFLEDYNSMSQMASFARFSDYENPDNTFAEIQTQEDVVSSLDSSSPLKDSSKAKSIDSDREAQIRTRNTMPSFGTEGDIEKRKVVIRRKRVLYPFAVVKPGPGCAEGDVTLNEINERLLMPPTRPVRHPVGDFACRPCISPHGPGLSGKAVVALTRLHTLGRRGTITIIRTKG